MKRAGVPLEIEVRDAHSLASERDRAQRDVIGIGVGAGSFGAAGNDGSKTCRRRNEKCRKEATSKSGKRTGARGSAMSGTITTNTAGKHNLPTRRCHVGLPGIGRS